jgi:hypothetical protein
MLGWAVALIIAIADGMVGRRGATVSGVIAGSTSDLRRQHTHAATA